MAAMEHVRRSTTRPSLAHLSLAFALGLLTLGACAHSTSSSGSAATSAVAPTPDPRVGLKVGKYDAGEAILNLKMLSQTRATGPFADADNTDLAFSGPYVFQGSYNGYQVWNISDPAKPVLAVAYLCPASQSDVSVYKNLLFVSGEGLSGRLDCGTQGVKDTVSAERLRGIRIFDITDIANPRYIANVQTCRGSHTHSVLVPAGDPDVIYIYVSGSAGIRSPSELPGCVKATPAEDSASALFRIEVIKVPLAHPEQAAIVSSPRIFSGLVEPKEHGDTPEDSAAAARELADAKSPGAGPRPGPTQCHDITLYPAIGLAGGACEGYGMLIDISDPVHPKRISAVSDSNFSYWHSATFNNSGTRVLFSDEWGGGGQPKCRAADPREWGADALFSIDNRQLQFHGYYKLPTIQNANENCVAHNGSLIPIPGRDVMVQAWYQGGLSVFDWTDMAHPKELAYFDRGGIDSTGETFGGYWSTYWYNGVIVGSESVRGLDIFELTPSIYLSQNEIDAAKSVHFDYFNVQGQQQFVWPASFALARAWLDQLERSKGLSASRIGAARLALTSAEPMSAGARKDALNLLASELEADAAKAGDPAKVRTLGATVKELAVAKS